MNLLIKNLKMLQKTNNKYCCCLGCGKKMVAHETKSHNEIECKKCMEERENEKK